MLLEISFFFIPQVNCLNNYANICFDFAGVLTRIDKINIDFILQILDL